MTPALEQIKALLPCPFCGSVPELQDMEHDTAGTYWVALCVSEECPASECVVDKPTREAAIAAWNTRLGTALQALRDEAGEAVPRVNIKCETRDGPWTGTTTLNVIRVEPEDDGSFTAVTDHWPAPAAEAASQGGVCNCGAAPDGEPDQTRHSADCGSYAATPPSAPAVEGEAAALTEFTDYFVRNYPGPDTIISDPKWHAPRIFRAAMHAIRRLSAPVPQEGADEAMVERAAKAISTRNKANRGVPYPIELCRADARAALEVALAARALPQGEAWRPMDTAPRDGTLLRLLVEFTEHATEDSPDPSPTIGANNLDNDGEDRWQFAGWCWTHDHFTEGKGTPVGWLPMLAAAPAQGVR